MFSTVACLLCLSPECGAIFAARTTQPSDLPSRCQFCGGSLVEHAYPDDYGQGVSEDEAVTVLMAPRRQRSVP